MPGDLRDLDRAFYLPQEVTSDPELRTLYEVLVARMREEAKDLTMNTVQQLLIERICFNYVVMRERERGELGGFPRPADQKDFNSFWLTMTAEFNRLVGRGEPFGVADRKALLKDMHKIIIEALNAIEDPRLRVDVMEKIAVGFDARGF